VGEEQSGSTAAILNKSGKRLTVEMLKSKNACNSKLKRNNSLRVLQGIDKMEKTKVNSSMKAAVM
jgi:hypothetical protein